MARKPVYKVLADYLGSAKPHLICRVDLDSELPSRLRPYVRKVGPCQEVIREGYDPYYSPLGCPVYWRIVSRVDEQFYCSTFMATRE